MSVTLKYFNEYLYYSAASDISQRVVEGGDRPLTTTQAKALRARLDEALASRSRTMQNAEPAVMREALDEVFGDYVQVVFTKDMYNQRVQEFSAYSGIRSKSMAANLKFDAQYIPLSPYDPDHADRDAFMRSGSQLLFASRSDVMTANQERTGLPPDQVRLYRESGRSMRETDMLLQSDADKSGVAFLAPYMTDAEYEQVSSWMGQAGESDPSRYMSQTALRKTAGLLRMMKENGIGYQVVPDENPGQVAARINGTRISVRLTDTRDNEQFVGRVYDDGQVYRYITNKQIQGNTHQTEAYVPRNEQECYDLLRYAMGDTVPRWDTGRPVGEAVTATRRATRWMNGQQRAVNEVRNASYHSGQNASYMIGPVPGDSQHSVFIHVDNNRGQANIRFQNAERSDAYLSDAVNSARRNFEEAVSAEDIIREAEAHRGEEDYSYEFSGDETIAAIQRGYWDILMSEGEMDVYRPDAHLEEYMDALGNDDEAVSLRDLPVYEGTPAEKVRQHFRDSVDYRIGSFEPDAEGKRFDPVNVARYMTSEYGQFSNNRNIVEALRESGITADELKGSDYYNKTVKDRLVRFDPNTASPMYLNGDEFVQDMYGTILKTIRESGCEVDEKDILMDANGIVHYNATRITSQYLKTKAGESTRKPVEGEIGQIFVPNGYGMVETKFAGSDNYLFVPGYEASVVTGPDTEGQSLEERIRLTGYRERMRQDIAHTLRGDLLANYDSVGSPTSVNGTYRQLYDERFALDWVEQSTREGMDDELREDIVRTLAGRVKMPKEFRDSSTVNADYTANLDTSGNIINTNFYSPYQASGRRNMAILSEEGDGYFDPVMTSSGIEQGITRYLTEGAKVNADGSVTPSEDWNDMAKLMKHPVMSYSGYDAWDRRQMTSANLIKASCVTQPVKTALMTLKGYDMDDAFVVSKGFSEQYQITTPDGTIRPLKVGDKISDPHGNKGVISLVVDPDMDPEEARKEGIDDVVAIFKNNEGLSVVGAPFSGVSRFNGGTAREMQSGDVDTLIGPNGENLGQSVGTMRYIVTHLSVDKKSSLYGLDSDAGKGRKAGAQLGMALSAADVPGIMREFYGNNVGPLRNFRELCIAVGGDISETGELRDSYTAHEGEQRKVFGMPDLEYTTRKTKSGESVVLDAASMKRKFGDIISRQGGFMELPFPLTYPNGKKLDKLTEDENVTVNYQKLEWQVTRHNKDGSTTTYTAHRHEDASTERSALKHKATYAMPVISSHLRSEQDFEDGTTHLHDYTNNYLKIYEAGLRYRDAESKGDNAGMMKYQRMAQTEYGKITGSLEARFIDAKKNMVRDGIMSNTIQTSATAVWTPDPKLGLGEIGIGREFAEGLGLKDGDKTLIWRDPILRESGLCYVQVKIDDKLTGISSNPVTAPRYEGDYDGDTIAVVPLRTKAAQRDAEEKFSMAATLLDKGYKREDGTFDFNLQGGLDIAAAHYKHPELAERREALRVRANEIEASDMSPADKLKANREVLAGLDTYVQDCFKDGVGSEVLRVGDAQQVIDSMSEMVEHGTKGSMGKLAKYAKFYGVSVSEKADGSPDFSAVEDKQVPLVDAQAAYDAQFCTAVKAHGTGTAGRYQHRGIEALRNECPRAVLELTRPVTQSLLQLKHEDKETAYRKYNMLMTTSRDLWRGYELERFERLDGTQGWKKVMGPDGKPAQATREKWVEQFMDVYTSKNGLDTPVNPDFVEQVSTVLEKHGKDGCVMNIENSAAGKSFMDRMAYSGSLETLYEGMEHRENMFDGAQNSLYMPRTVRDNQYAAENGGETKAIAARDTGESFKPKASERAAAAAPQVRKKRVSDLSEDIPNGFGSCEETDSFDTPA